MVELGSHDTDEGAVSWWMLLLAGGLVVLAATFITVAYVTGMPDFRATQTAATVPGGAGRQSIST